MGTGRSGKGGREGRNGKRKKRDKKGRGGTGKEGNVKPPAPRTKIMVNYGLAHMCSIQKSGI